MLKPLVATLSLSIAPLKYSNFEGTAALYFCLGKDTNCVSLLTCIYVIHLPPIYSNTQMTDKNTSQPCEEIVVLDNMGYRNAIMAMMVTIGNHLKSIEIWNTTLDMIGESVSMENSKVTGRCKT
ncbi:unnamed protein product [Tuber aestivum]|uniref:Uncharacterized protein n=1 Tax=Tuber aestivum TaxID=59557 RepID=A0A292PXS2_9PEZI|nr:unnamed protein product [Tuber aestivum]